MSEQTRKKGIRKRVQTSSKSRNSAKKKQTNRKGNGLSHKSKSEKNKRNYGVDPMIGVFCEVFGANVRNRVVENLLAAKYVGIAIPDLAKESGISKQRAYEIIYEFEKKAMIKRHRIIGKTQIWIINENNDEIKILQIAFKECMKLVGEEYKYSDDETKVKTKIVS